MIAIEGLRKQFADGTAISYRDTVFEDGKTYVLLGASGCGKSTLLNMIAGVLSPSEGRVLIDGRDMAAASQRERDAFRIANIGYVFQDFKLLEDMTVADNIDVLRLERIDTSGQDELLRHFGILGLKKRRARTLSGGEKQRVAVARALVKKPRIILADEPTGNLNFAVGRAIVDELLGAAKGNTLLCVTHDERLAPLFDEVLDMNGIASAEGGEG